jgi:hypothetical protein
LYLKKSIKYGLDITKYAVYALIFGLKYK